MEIEDHAGRRAWTNALMEREILSVSNDPDMRGITIVYDTASGTDPEERVTWSMADTSVTHVGEYLASSCKLSVICTSDTVYVRSAGTTAE